MMRWLERLFGVDLFAGILLAAAMFLFIAEVWAIQMAEADCRARGGVLTKGVTFYDCVEPRR